jgi:peptidoglycan/LPS O-acetylase OafA/YrhL
LRFSRLYPLHFATLLAVCLLEFVDFHQRGLLLGWMPHDDLLHFLLQLGFASNWWPNSPQSFNGPIWSVSIEVLLYALFFIAAKSALLQPKTTAIAVIAGFLFTPIHFTLGQGLAMFFLGGLISHLVQGIRTQPEVSVRQVAVVICCTILTVLVIFKVTHRGFSDWLLLAIVFPGLILFFAYVDETIDHWVRPFRWLGSISYSMYLIHIPLMLLTMLLGLAYPESPMFLFMFMTVLIGLSLVSFRYFEFPAQQFLRATLLSRFMSEQAETAR